MTTAGKSNLVDVEVIYIHQTDKGVCVKEAENGPDIWLPKSQIEIEPARGAALSRGCLATLTAPEPLLIQKGMFLA